MTKVLTDLRQLRSRDTLTQISPNTSGVQADAIVRSIDSELDMPLRMRQTYPTANLVLNIENITLTNPLTLRNKTIPPINNVLPVFTSGTITIDTTGAGNATPSIGSAFALGMTASRFLKIGVNLLSNGSLVLIPGTIGASLAAATNPAMVGFAIGYFVVRTDGSNNTQTILNSDIYQYVGGGGGSGNSGYARIFLSQ